MEFALVAVGAWTYWRATREITVETGQGRHRAALVTALILIGGTVVLAHLHQIVNAELALFERPHLAVKRFVCIQYGFNCGAAHCSGAREKT